MLQAQRSPQLTHAQRGCLPHAALQPPAAAHIHTECRSAGCSGAATAATAAAATWSDGSSCMAVGRCKQLAHARRRHCSACQAYRVQAGALRQRRS